MAGEGVAGDGVAGEGVAGEGVAGEDVAGEDVGRKGAADEGAVIRDAAGEGVARRRVPAVRHASVRVATTPRYPGLRYRAPPPGPPTDVTRRNPVHSILSALPVMMLMAGLYSWYHAESAQSGGAPILAESVAAHGRFKGLSVVESGGEGRHYLWFDDGVRVHGVRVKATQHSALGALEAGDEIELRLAPTVSGSSTLWAWHVEHGGTVLIDALPPDAPARAPPR